MSSTTPPPTGSGEPEFLDPTDGDPVKPSGGKGTNGRRTALVAGGAAVGLALVGGAAWAAVSFLATGPQPAEALPGSTLGYASVDLDPSGGQKIEAFRMIQEFPALKKELDGLDADDDLVAKLFDQVEENCDGVDYDDDIKPWLGKRFAAAAVDLGEDLPTPVGVLQVTDADAARDGLATLQKCAGSDVGGWSIDGEWAVIAETEDLADQVTEATADGSLAEDATYQQWTDEVGDAGVVNLYAAPKAPGVIAEFLKPQMWAEPGAALDLPERELPEEMTKAFEDFGGMAATLRFDEGSLELELAGDAGKQAVLPFAGEDAAASVGSLPEDTAAALGIGLPQGWVQKVLDQMEGLSDGGATAEDLLAQMEAQTGLTAADIETLLGESAAVAVSSDIDPEAVFGSADGSGLPVGAKIKGDAGGIQDVLEKIGAQAGGDAAFLGNDADGDFVAVGPNGDYRKALLEDGSLGDSEVFKNVVREADDAGAILFVNFDAGDWLANLARTDPEAKQNLEPLQGLGFSSWVEDDAAHAVLRLTTD